jgi:hypothetical protein
MPRTLKPYTMKKILFAFVTVAILAMSPADKDKVTRELVRFISRFINDQSKIIDVRKEFANITYNMDKDSCLTSAMKRHILKADSLLKNLSERNDFTGEEFNHLCTKYELMTSK